ncbi:uncharacterized protein TNIN_1781, partial [Trichonephila inaurata madagascariensis]
RWTENQESVKLSKSEQTTLRARCQPLVTKSWIKTKTDLAEAWQFHSDIQGENRIEGRGRNKKDDPGTFNFSSKNKQRHPKTFPN